jgi:hypothetical protein
MLMRYVWLLAGGARCALRSVLWAIIYYLLLYFIL